MAGNPMTPWTPRERALRAALEGVMELAKEWSSAEMSFAHPLSGARESDAAIAAEEALETHIDAALSDPPPPDPRDEALNQAEAELLRLWKLVPPGRAGVGGVRTIELEDDEVARLQQIVDAIRAAKGGA
jgi:hypothetical protein